MYDIVIIGGGPAGMTAALELSKAGYECQILEARSFAGGRRQTARKGFVLNELGGEPHSWHNPGRDTAVALFVLSHAASRS